MAKMLTFGVGPATRGTALVVDSDPIQAASLADTLRERRYVVFEASSFAEAKQLFDDEQPDLLVADVRLGSYNGLHLLVRARARRPDLAAVITSPVPDAVLAAEARRFGGEFLLKPVDPERLLAALGHRDLPPDCADASGRPSAPADATAL